MSSFSFEARLVQLTFDLSNSQQTKLLLVSSDAQAQRASEMLLSLSGGFLKNHDIVCIPGFFQAGVFRYESAKKVIAKRIHAAFQLQNEIPKILICTPAGLARHFPRQEWLQKQQILIKKNQIMDMEKMSELLSSKAYIQTNRVEEVGEYAIRGSILDFWTPSEKNPVRIEFSDDQIEHIRLFRPADQRSFETKDQIFLLPCREFVWPNELEKEASIEKFNKSILLQGVTGNTRAHLLEDLTAQVPFAGIDDLFSCFSFQTLHSFWDEIHSIAKEKKKEISFCVVEEKKDLKKAFDEIHKVYDQAAVSAQNHNELIAKKDTVFPGLETIGKQLEGDCVLPSQFQIPNDLLSQLIPLEKQKFSNRVQKIKEFVQEQKIEKLVFSVENEDAFFEFSGLMSRDFPVLASDSFLPHGFSFEDHQIQKTDVVFLKSAFGFYLPKSNALVISESWLRNTSSRTQNDLQGDQPVALTRSNTEAFLAAQFSEFVQGDLVVHVQHGIARFLGLMTLKIADTSNDFLALEYAGNDKVYVPVHKMNLVQKYVGASENTALDSLKGSSWEKRRERVQKDIEKIAKELMEYQAKRAMTPGHAFAPIDQEYIAFEDAFAFDETPDQTKAIAEIMSDMGQTKAMDRLLCGDVGFGKTEVAMRAAYRCVLDGKQVAWLVPTTVLAHQHFRSLKERFLEFGVQVEMLDRSVTSGLKILDRLKNGHIDILIGTHRILSKDIVFRDLGLLVVDEEQRFGVLQKEKIKAMSYGVDVLTMTATPIPRTLQMAMSGMRELSLLTTPPKARLATKTFVCPFDDDIVRNAILFEKSRGGQIFYVHNRVTELDAVQTYLQGLLPNIRIVMAHGKMSQKDLESKILSFLDGQYDVLLCTTIIESGVDMPNVNTIIVQNANHFGLAQLYQLRGRVGRRSTRGQAYFLTSEQIKDDAEGMQRLQILQDHQELGSGFVIASHDLEMRGCGNILGDDQSGKVADVGLETYLQMLDDAIKELGGQKVTALKEVEIQIPVEAHIPESYIENAKERLRTYRRFFGTKDEKALMDLVAECQDRFSEMPIETKWLVEIARIRRLLVSLGAVSLAVGDDATEIRLDKRIIQPQEQDEFADRTIRRILDVCNHRVKHMRLTPDGRLLFPLRKKQFEQDVSLGFAEIKRVLGLLLG